MTPLLFPTRNFALMKTHCCVGWCGIMEKIRSGCRKVFYFISKKVLENTNLGLKGIGKKGMENYLIYLKNLLMKLLRWDQGINTNIL